MSHKNYTWDMFICYASENRNKIANPLYNKLIELQLKVWIDWKEFHGGDNHTKKIRKALDESMFIVAIFSKHSQGKTYPKMEIGGVIFNPNHERERIIPVYYNTTVDENENIDDNIKIDHIENLHKLRINGNDPDFEKHLDEIAEDINIRVQDTKDEIKREKKKRQWKKILFITLPPIFLLLTLYFTSIKYLPDETKNPSTTPFDTSKGSYNVLLFPFQPLEKCQFKKTYIENTIITRLLDMNDRDNLNLQIKFDTIDCVRSYADADSLGKKLYAHLVIWGDLYEHCSSDAKEACLKFVNISLNNPALGIKEKGESGIEKMTSLAEVREGKLQKDIDFIIYWVAASRTYLKNDYNTTLKHFMRLENSGNVTDALFFSMADCYHHLEFFDSTIIYLEKTLKINPDHYGAHNNYALFLAYKLNNIDSARIYLERAIKINTNHVQAHFNYANLLADKFNDSIKAKEQFEIVLKINPNTEYAHYRYAALLQSAFNMLDSAMEHYKIVFKTNPNNAQAHNNCALILSKKFNDNLGAKWHYLEAIRVDSGLMEANYNYAVLLANKFDNADSAKIYYEKTLRINPLHAFAHFNYADLLANKFNKSDSARVHYEAALKINPQFAEAYINYAKLLKEKFNKTDKAKKYYLKAIRLKPEFKEKVRDDFFGIK